MFWNHTTRSCKKTQNQIHLKNLTEKLDNHWKIRICTLGEQLKYHEASHGRINTKYKPSLKNQLSEKHDRKFQGFLIPSTSRQKCLDQENKNHKRTHLRFIRNPVRYRKKDVGNSTRKTSPTKPRNARVSTGNCPPTTKTQHNKGKLEKHTGKFLGFRFNLR